MNRAHLLMVVAALSVVACQDQPPPAGPRLPDGPVFEISDGHTNGNPAFFFLAPIRRLGDDATVPNVGFDATLDPVIEVYECAGTSPTGCVLPLGALKSRITQTSGNVLLNRLFVLPHFQEYFALWDTHDLGLRSDRTYRIQVKVGSTVLGFADVDVVRTLKEVARVDRDDFVALLQNFLLPIRFWIGTDALCPGGGTCRTINLAEGGSIELVAAGEDFKVDIPTGTTATYNGQTVPNVTVALETCEGIDVDLPTLGPCLRLTTFFDATGDGELEFSRPVLLSWCVLNSELPPEEPRQEELITLHQQDGSLIRALPHATPSCGQIGANGWDWLKNLATRLLAPKPAFAATRTALLHVGAGGETSVLGAQCQPPNQAPGKEPGGIMRATVCPPNSPLKRSGPRGAPRAATAAPPKTTSDFQFALPAKMDYVDPDDASRSAPPGTDLGTAVKVTDWDGAPVRGARVTFTESVAGAPPIVLGTAFSDENGVAQIFWTIHEGPNSAVATGRGIAAQNNYPNGTVKPFMPDISLPTGQQNSVALGTGTITFLATGVAERFPELDQQNVLDGSLGGQGIGRFNDINGDPDPNGTAFDFQDAQTFTVGISGRLAQIKVPLINSQEASIGVTMQIVAVNADGFPDETHSRGEVTIPASAISTSGDDRFNPTAWATFDLTSLAIDVTSGEQLAFIVRTVSPIAYLYNPEFSEGYTSGRGFRRNLAVSAGWSNSEADFGFQTFVIPN